jgi:hypothetical protein
MDALISIPYVDIRKGTPFELLKAHLSGAHALVAAASGTYGPLGQIASLVALPLGDRASEIWLERAKNPYLDEVRAMASLLGRSGVYFLNVCFEWGCTSGVWRTPEGPLLRRVLDWPFPALGEYLLVAHQSGPAGDFLNATWPGVSGIFQASAPGRFAAALNQAPSRERGYGFAGDWLSARVALRDNAGLPPAHLLRRVFETAPDYDSAKRMLSETPLAVPAIFILAGPEEGCVIERVEDGFVVRETHEGRVCATNHFIGRAQGWRARPIDSAGRLDQALGLSGTEDDFAWFTPPIANANSRLAMSACPKSGMLSLIGTNGAIPVTETFRA